MEKEKACTSAQNSGKFIDTLIEHWVSRTGGNIPLQQPEEQVAEGSNKKDGKEQQVLQNQERVIQSLKRKLKESQETEASLSNSLEVEIRNKEEIQTKLDATWVYIENITEYFNYIRESLASFQQHCDNLSTIYDNVILKQQETIQKRHQHDTDQENHIAQLKNKLLSQEERLREAMAEQNKLQKQLENTQYKFQLQKNELININAEEKQERQRLLLEYENLQLRLQTVEKEKCDIAKSAAQLENKLLLQEEKLEKALIEQNKLKKKAENAEREFQLKENELIDTYDKEKKKLIEELQKLQLELKNMQSQINTIEQDKIGIAENVAQKDMLISDLENKISMYKNQIDTIMVRHNETNTNYEALIEKQNKQEKELLTKTEKIQNLEEMLNVIKQRESGLVNDINRLEKRLTNEMDFAKSLETKLSIAQKNLHLAQEENTDVQKILQKTYKEIEACTKEKEEAIKRESTKTKKAETLYENAQAKHSTEMLTLKNTYETQLRELKKTVDSLTHSINDVTKENTTLNKSLTDMKMENIHLKSNYDFIMNRNEDLQTKLNETPKVTQIKSVDDDQNPTSKFTKSQYSADNTPYNSDEDTLISPTLNRTPLKRRSQKEQEAEVTSASKKFFKSRSVQPRTYVNQRKK